MTFFWRFLEKNHHEPPRTTTENHYEPLWTTTKLPWLNHYEPPWTTTNHHGKPRKTTTNHYEPPRNYHDWTTTNHYEPPWTTTNHHEPPQSLIQNEIWYWILDSDWLNSGSHDIFLRILEKNYHEPPWTTTNHHKPLWTTMNHYEPPRTTTIEPPRTMTKSHLLPGVVSVAGGSRWQECSVLENFAWLPALKMAEIAVLGLIRVSQENWKFFLCNFGQIFHYFKQFRGIFKVGNSIFCSSLVVGGTPI